MNPLFRAMDSYGRCTASTKEWQTVRSLEPKILSTVYITKAFFFSNVAWEKVFCILYYRPGFPCFKLSKLYAWLKVVWTVVLTVNIDWRLQDISVGIDLKELGTSEVEMSEILPRDWNLKPIFTQMSFCRHERGVEPPPPNPPPPTIPTLQDIGAYSRCEKQRRLTVDLGFISRFYCVVFLYFVCWCMCVRMGHVAWFK